MKTHSLLISFLMLLVIMGACSSGPVMRNATGFAYEIVVTMDKAGYQSRIDFRYSRIATG